MDQRIETIKSRKITSENYFRSKLKKFKKYLSDLVVVLKRTGNARKVLKVAKAGIFEGNKIQQPNAHRSNTRPYIGKTQCQGNTNEKESRAMKYFFVSEVEITIESATTSWIRYKSPQRNQRKLLNLFNYNDWSPRFKVQTAKILGDIVHKNPFSDVQYGIRLRGFSPYLFHRDSRDFGFYTDGDGNLISTLLNGLISLKKPEQSSDNEHSDGYWSIFRCKAF